MKSTHHNTVDGNSIHNHRRHP